jgi:Transposase
MGRPPSIPAEKKTRIVLSVLAGEMSIAEAARKEKVSEQSIGRWKAEFLDAGMSTARFCQLFDMPERTWRRWQAKARTGAPTKGPWPQPARQAARELVRRHALTHPAWGPPEDLGDGPPRRARGLRSHRVAYPAGRGTDSARGVPTGTTETGRAAQGRFRHRAQRTDPGLAAGLQRVRDVHRRDLAAGRMLRTTGPSTSAPSTSRPPATSTTR